MMSLIRSFAGMFLFSLLATIGFSQTENEVFTITKEIKHTPVISQGSTGTCWSFATTSFLESEIMRMGFPETDLSEMFFVNYAYLNKARQYLLYQGGNNFGQGGQAHDVFNVIRTEGMLPFEDFPGEKIDGKYQHRALISELKAEVDSLNKRKKDFDVENLKSMESILKDKIGKVPHKIKTDNGKVTPADFFQQFDLNPDDYIEITSFMHHPFYKSFVLEVPDNWAHALYYNVPVDELMEIINFALNNGYSVDWDGDTSEKTFTHKKGKADLPEEQQGKVDNELRLKTFENRTTTDDHLMHIVGLSNDAAGGKCYYTKNSWGAESNAYGGYLHLTEDYVRLKTIAIVVHKNAIPDSIKQKLGI